MGDLDVVRDHDLVITQQSYMGDLANVLASELIIKLEISKIS